MAKYASFLSWLISMGPKVPRIIALLQELAAIFMPPADEGTLQMVAVTPDEEDLERQVFALAVPAGSLGVADPGHLRKLFKFLNDSGLLSILIGLATKG